MSLRRTPMRSRPRNTGPRKDVVDAVLDRDQHSCVVCGNNLHGTRGRDWSTQHRRARGMGGDRRPDVNLPANLLAVCGSGTTGCHGWIEARPEEALEAGYRIRQSEDPTEIPVACWYGVALLDNRGGMRLYRGDDDG